ncbi:MAG TPA: PilX N-terminal domain-containing pilus assembly protein [Rhodocyclaceae bacterium]|nr:PilX N-terminal domain-containing pilus assembly protein [Rhodocyclaceae bacterium]
MRQHNAGMALIICLLMLLVSTILGMAAVRGAVLGERVAGNHRQASDAFMAAEAGVAAALTWFQADPDHYSDEGGYWILAADDVSTAARKTTAIAHAVAADGSTLRAGVSWHIEELTRVGDHAMRFTSAGSVAGTGATRRITAVFERPHALAAEAPAAEAAYTCFGRDCLVSIGGSAFVDGRDWNPPTDFDCQGAGCRGTQLDPLAHPAVAGIFLTDDGTIAAGGGDRGRDALASHVDGDPATRITAAYDGASDVAYWRDYAEALGAAIAIDGTVSTGTIGTRAEPRVSEVAASARITGTVDGAGVLIVRESARLEITGTFHFEGLIIVEAGATIGMGSGNVNVFGAIVALGGHATDVDGDFTGNIAVRYSSAALANLTNIETEAVPGGLSAWQEL